MTKVAPSDSAASDILSDGVTVQEAASAPLLLTEPDVPREAARPHLAYLDGLRGLAALSVVFHHVVLYTMGPFTDKPGANGRAEGPMPLWLNMLWSIFGWGAFAVVTFIVLSGYCLMIPVARSPERGFKGGVVRYLKRRAWRILPPYYASLGFSMAFIVALRLRPEMRADDPHVNWLGWLPAFTPDVLLSHALLIHNLKPDWMHKINGPTWTIATEWQLYFLLPILVLLWRRWGVGALVAGGFAAWIFVQFVLHRFFGAHPWFAPCFALGAAGAVLNFDSQTRSRWTTPRTLRIALLVLSPIFVLATLAGRWERMPVWASEIVFGLGVALLLVTLSDTLIGQYEPRAAGVLAAILRVLGSPSVVALGAMSYSLYLVHGPMLNTLQWWARTHDYSPIATISLLFFAGVPMSLLTARIFYRLIEAPSMRARL